MSVYAHQFPPSADSWVGVQIERRWRKSSRYPHRNAWSPHGSHPLDSRFLSAASAIPRKHFHARYSSRSPPVRTHASLASQVVDEADRLLTQSFHDWLPSILSALKPSTANAQADGARSASDAVAPECWDDRIGRVGSDLDVRALSSASLRLLSMMYTCSSSPLLRQQCQKLLFSATLSRDPAKIDALHLHRPVYVSVEDALDPHAEDEGVDGELKFTFPANLKVR